MISYLIICKNLVFVRRVVGFRSNKIQEIIIHNYIKKMYCNHKLQPFVFDITRLTHQVRKHVISLIDKFLNLLLRRCDFMFQKGLQSTASKLFCSYFERQGGFIDVNNILKDIFTYQRLKIAINNMPCIITEQLSVYKAFFLIFYIFI